ncbi:hypothetical protein TSUD_351640 [Trifolium subterraneum]|uniref:Retrotransposon Copia-like N-terminal domain-containing protein n=1 Tax=Trifolium subterraneum TaxID=3900 RepID=A0A2Z6NW22_TRISU|nr:hypothetical protein TSUD_351640 [Trifolium subterraneum]
MATQSQNGEPGIDTSTTAMNLPNTTKDSSKSDRLDGKTSDEYQKWLFKDQTLFTWLLSTISDSVLPRVVHCKHAHENTKKLGRPVSEYLLRIKSIVNSLIAMGVVVTEQDQVDAILDGLPEDFNSFVMMVYSRFDTPTVEDVEEARQNQYNQEAEDHESSTEQYNSNSYRGRGRGKGKTKGRGKAPNAPNTGKCQICTKSNHDATNCWYRYEPPSSRANARGYNAGNTSRAPPYNPYPCPAAHLALPQYYHPIPDMDTVSTSSWYPDSGASHHLTFNPNNLAYRMPYQGQDQVTMGNGQGY